MNRLFLYRTIPFTADRYIKMSSAFVELLQKSNLDYLVVQKPFKVGSHNDDIIFASFIDMKTKTLQVKNQ
jgi:hypothetical protein